MARRNKEPTDPGSTRPFNRPRWKPEHRIKQIGPMNHGTALGTLRGHWTRCAPCLAITGNVIVTRTAPQPAPLRFIDGLPSHFVYESNPSRPPSPHRRHSGGTHHPLPHAPSPIPNPQLKTHASRRGSLRSIAVDLSRQNLSSPARLPSPRPPPLPWLHGPLRAPWHARPRAAPLHDQAPAAVVPSLPRQGMHQDRP